MDLWKILLMVSLLNKSLQNLRGLEKRMKRECREQWFGVVLLLKH